MHILFERTGGFAGRKLQGSLDSSQLPLPQARRLKTLLKQSGFFDLPAALKSGGEGADRFNYRVTIRTEDRSHTVEASDAAIPGKMRPLLEFLTRTLLER